MSDNDLFKGLGIGISLAHPNDFLKVKETLTRMGVSSKKEKKLFQSCHILHKRGCYAILHFKEMFLLDGRPKEVPEEDLARRNTIAKLLDQWKLVTLHEDIAEENCAPMNQVKIIPFREKEDWILEAKYSIGKDHK